MTQIDEISQTVSAIPPLMLTSEVVSIPEDEVAFVSAYETNNEHLVNNTVPELNALKTQFNTSVGQINTVAQEIQDIGENAINAITFDNIAQLKLNSNMGRVDVLGYYAKGDGGGGTFYWDSASTETDNGGTIIQATGVTTGRWKRVFSGAVNVKWFGAKGDYYLSDGRVNSNPTDNTQAIQKAIDTGLDIYIPGGAYLHDGLIVSFSNMSFYGDKAILIKKNRDDTNNINFKTNFVLLNINNININNLEFRISDNQHSCIYIQKCENINISNCIFFAYGTHTTGANGAYGIHALALDDTSGTSGVWVYDDTVFGGSKYLNISECSFYDFGFGVRLQSVDYADYSVTHSKIYKCLFKKTWYESIEILYSNKNSVIGCTFVDIYNGGIDFDKGSSFCIASGNMIDGISYSIDPNHPEQRRFAGIKVAGADASTNGAGITRIASDNIISNNIIKSANTSSFDNENPYGGIVSSIAERTIIENNIIKLNVYISGCDGIKLQGRNINTSVCKNTISSIYNGIATYNEKYNAWTNDEGMFDGVFISDNIISDFQKSGIWIGSNASISQALLLLNNFIVQNNTVSTNHNSNTNVSIEITCNGAIVSNNNIFNNLVQKSFRVNGKNIVMKNNYMKNNAGSYSYIFNSEFTPTYIDNLNYNSSKDEELTISKLWQPINCSRRIFNATAIPVSGYMNKGDLIINVEPSTGEDGFWIITTSGYACPSSSWSSSTTYSQGETIRYSVDGKVYLSLLNSNTNNQPNISPTYWTMLGTPYDYKKIGTVGS